MSNSPSFQFQTPPENNDSSSFSIEELVQNTEGISPEEDGSLDGQMSNEIGAMGDQLERVNHIEQEDRPLKKKNKRESLSERRARSLMQKHEAELVRLREENERLRNESLSLANDSLMNEEDSIRLKKIAIKKALELAKEEGSTSVEADAIEALTRVSAQEAALEQKKQLVRNYQYQEPPSNVDTSYYDTSDGDYEDESDPVLEQWVQKNPWIDRSSGAFDPELAQEAALIKSSLDKELKLTDRYNLIGTPEYYDEITIRLKNAYGASQQPQTERKKTSSRSPFVSPSPTSSPYRQQGYGMSNQRDENLSPIEMEIAVKTIGYNNPKMTDQQRIQLYKQHKLAMKKNGTYNSNRFEL